MVKVRSALAAWGLVLSLFFGPADALIGGVQDSTSAIGGGHRSEGAVRSDTTNSSGVFTATLLPAGAYTVQVNSPGFGKATVGGIEVRVSSHGSERRTTSPTSHASIRG